MYLKTTCCNATCNALLQNNGMMGDYYLFNVIGSETDINLNYRVMQKYKKKLLKPG